MIIVATGKRAEAIEHALQLYLDDGGKLFRDEVREMVSELEQMPRATEQEALDWARKQGSDSSNARVYEMFRESVLKG